MKYVPLESFFGLLLFLHIRQGLASLSCKYQKYVYTGNA